MLEEKVKEVIREISGVENIKESDDLLDDIGLDSLGMVTLLVELEDTFSIKIDESDMNPFDLLTVQDVIDLAEKYTEVHNEQS